MIIIMMKAYIVFRIGFCVKNKGPHAYNRIMIRDVDAKKEKKKKKKRTIASRYQKGR